VNFGLAIIRSIGAMENGAVKAATIRIIFHFPISRKKVYLRGLFVFFFHSLLSTLYSLLLLSCTPKPPEGMVLIPAGPFIMGTDDLNIEELAEEAGMGKTWMLDAAPAHRVDLPGFFIDRYEITNAEYERFVRERNFPVLPHWPDGRPGPEQGRLPVVYVSWPEAQAYCAWTGGRLPSEAEWEKAARGPDGKLYPWGNVFEPGLANVAGVRPGPEGVGSFPGGNASTGVTDMIGNVWEWTASWYDAYPGSDYPSPNFGKKYRVARGNSFAELGHFPPELREAVAAAQARATYRLFLPPNAAIEDIGFRCAKPVDP
jgi:formylglycine-generating enzyme required for sulfatase activity